MQCLIKRKCLTTCLERGRKLMIRDESGSPGAPEHRGDQFPTLAGVAHWRAPCEAAHRTTVDCHGLTTDFYPSSPFRGHQTMLTELIRSSGVRSLLAGGLFATAEAADRPRIRCRQSIGNRQPPSRRFPVDSLYRGMRRPPSTAASVIGMPETCLLHNDLLSPFGSPPARGSFAGTAGAATKR